MNSKVKEYVQGVIKETESQVKVFINDFNESSENLEFILKESLNESENRWSFKVNLERKDGKRYSTYMIGGNYDLEYDRDVGRIAGIPWEVKRIVEAVIEAELLLG